MFRANEVNRVNFAAGCLCRIGCMQIQARMAERSLRPAIPRLVGKKYMNIFQVCIS